MKYFIAGKELHTDRKLEAGSLQDYTELGFECVYSHLLAKRYINNGILDKNEDVVVTCKGREFFYNHLIKTIYWEEYENIKKLNLTISINASEFIVDSVLMETFYFHENYMKNSKPFQEIYDKNLSWEDNYKKYVTTGNPKYKFHEEDYDLITSFEKNNNLNFPKKYICFNRRFRKHREEYNTDYEYAKELIVSIINEFDVDVFITGFHNEKFEEINRVKWVDLKDWCTYLNHENCLSVVQDQTGTSNLSQIFGKEKLLNIVTNNDQTMFTNPLYLNGRRPDVLGKAVNFKNLRNVVLKGPSPNIKEIINYIKKYSI
jgi:hypothetical protein